MLVDARNLKREELDVLSLKAGVKKKHEVFGFFYFKEDIERSDLEIPEDTDKITHK